MKIERTLLFGIAILSIILRNYQLFLSFKSKISFKVRNISLTDKKPLDGYKSHLETLLGFYTPSLLRFHFYYFKITPIFI